MKIAIQGIKGSFHHIVADNYFGENVELMECMTFSEMPDLVLNGSVDAAVMAIENSIAGAILPNYALIDEANLEVSGEYYLPIHQNFMALKGEDNGRHQSGVFASYGFVTMSKIFKRISAYSC